MASKAGCRGREPSDQIAFYCREDEPMDLPPRIAYVLLWFPKPSETFIFREVANLWRMGLQLKVFSLYGRLSRNLSPEMRLAAPRVETLGLPYLPRAWQDVLYWWRRKAAVTWHLFKTALCRCWLNPEREGESLWGALCGAHLARRCLEDRITHIHAPWACGPASAAWVASHLTGIPFSFTGRAHDIFTPDSLLPEKIRDAQFVRCESKAVMQQLAHFTGGDLSKFRLTYNGVPLTAQDPAPVRMRPPYRLLALGRLVATKGFDVLIRACRILQDGGLDLRLTLAGAGPQGWRLKRLARKLGLAAQISFPGFIRYDKVADQFGAADVFIMPCIVDPSGNRDGLPTVILEALLHRVPVIATDVAGIEEVIEDGVTGLLISPGDPQAIAAAVLQMIRHRDAALEMAARGRVRVLTEFNPEANHRRVLELFQAADQGRPPAN
jgi:colanic acid/amylovoran biosynthesis glycosyltransferase